MFKLLASLFTVTPIDDDVPTVTHVETIDPDSSPTNARDIQRVRGYNEDNDNNMTANDWKELNK